ncbi:MAG: hypothetical protein NWQ53_04515, partial [Flavobacteriales bacterium]|nr:hypothetical protein [Flavobacteriales bacterium]
FTVHKSKGLEFPYVIYPMAYSSWWDIRGDLPIHLDQPIHGLQKALLPAKQGMGGSAIQAQYDLEAERLLLDELNTTYVATTRAEKGLIVLLELKDDLAKGTSGRFRIPEMVFHWAKDRFADFEKTYQVLIGEIHPSETKVKHHPEKNQSTGMSAFERGPLSERLKLAFDKDLRLLREGKLNAREIGNEVHFGLSRIKDLSDFSSYKKLEFPWVRMDEDDWEKIVEQMGNVLHHPKCKQWFSKDHRAIVERSLITPDGKELRPDRVVFLEDHIAIIDFKTGAKEKEHEQQIRHYIKAIEALEKQKVRGFLVYSDEMVVLEVAREEGQISLF